MMENTTSNNSNYMSKSYKLYDRKTNNDTSYMGTSSLTRANKDTYSPGVSVSYENQLNGTIPKKSSKKGLTRGSTT